MKFANEHIEQILKGLPSKPGVYQYFDENGAVIYVGKAKNLKNRVSSYFQTKDKPLKTANLVRNIRDIRYIVVESEQDAFLLENNLIKQYQPHYNILLKDGKSYPSICITKEEFPRVFKTRQINKQTGEYYGPFSYSETVDLVLELIHELYPIRTCKLSITDESIENKKHKVCLKYHIHKCCGICEGKCTKEQYNDYIDDIRKIIKGDAAQISERLETEMKSLAAKMEYEKAEQIKRKYILVEKFRSKTIITNTAKRNVEIYGYEQSNDNAFVSVLRVHNGSIIQGQVMELRRNLDETKEEILSYAIKQLREKLSESMGGDTEEYKDIIVPFLPDTIYDDCKYSTPQNGERKKLLQLAQQNVAQYIQDKQRSEDKMNPERKNERILERLQELLKLAGPPKTIESFDNSNIQGTDAVASCVVISNGTFDKSNYRKYNIKTVHGADDYASMREIAYRRYKVFSQQLSEEDKRSDDNSHHPLPDLILADGGKGQMEALREVIEDRLGLSIPIAGMVKDDHHRTAGLLYGNPANFIQLKANDELFLFLTRVQDEVHRYAIGFHRDKRSKSHLRSELTEIKGIGEKTQKQLISHFKSVKNIRTAEFAELEKNIGTSKATVVYEYFHGSLSR